MIKSHVIQTREKSRSEAELALGERFNEWVANNPKAKVLHLFDPERWDETHGNYNYNKYNTSLTFFYEVLPNGLKELQKDE